MQAERVPAGVVPRRLRLYADGAQCRPLRRHRRPDEAPQEFVYGGHAVDRGDSLDHLDRTGCSGTGGGAHRDPVRNPALRAAPRDLARLVPQVPRRLQIRHVLRSAHPDDRDLLLDDGQDPLPVVKDSRTGKKRDKRISGALEIEMSPARWKTVFLSLGSNLCSLVQTTLPSDAQQGRCANVKVTTTSGDHVKRIIEWCVGRVCAFSQSRCCCCPRP